MISGLIVIAVEPLLASHAAQALQGPKLPIIVIAEKITEAEAADIGAYRNIEGDKDRHKILEKHGLQIVKLKSGLLVFDERSIGLHELRVRGWVLENMLVSPRTKTLSSDPGLDSEVKTFLASIAPTEQSAFMASDITVAFNPVAILGFQVGQGPVRNVTEKLFFNGEPPLKPAISRHKESALGLEKPSAVEFHRWPPTRIEERFFHVTAALPMARLRQEASEQIEGLIKQEQDSVDLKTSQVFNGLSLGMKRLQEKLKSDGKLDYKSLSPEDQRLLSSIMIRNSYQEADLMNVTFVGSIFGISVEATYQMSTGQSVGVAWVFDITPR